MEYKQLTLEQRYQIQAYSKAGWSNRKIAKEIEFHHSAISREIIRNSGMREYRAKDAQVKAIEREKTKKKKINLTVHLKFEIAKKIREDWSPEQISGYFKLHKIGNISHQAIYNAIADDRVKGGMLYKYLRHARKKRRKCYGSKDTRGQIKNRILIDQRPEIVDQKTRIGDWEIDTVIGKNHKGAIVTLVERKSKFFVATIVKNRKEQVVSKATVKSLWPYKDKTNTITGDNGKEFAGHEKISRALDSKFYFAHPYSSWERGLNENTNGLLRQYFPKKTDFRSITQDDINPVLEKINTRPRKTLGYATPKEVFFGLTERVCHNIESVALVT